jgi:FKBP-type peptidyl-prolyl cis-trans isomerase FkpA
MKKVLLGCTILFAFASCLKSDEANNTTGPCNYDTCSVKAPASEIQMVQNYLASASISASQHCSGVFYVINDPGTGTQATACSNVTVSYVGRLTDGTIFDQTNAQRPTFSSNLRNLIAGWTNTVPMLRSGGRITIYVPPSLGYGNRAVQGIPANSVLIFEITLQNVF